MLKYKLSCWVLFLFLTGIAAPSFAQKEIDKEGMAELAKLEDSLSVLADSMYNAPIPDYRVDYCVKFTKTLRKALDIPNSFYYPFSKLEQKVHILYPEDKSFRIINWMIAPSEMLRRYYGAIQMQGTDLKLFPLRDFSEKLDQDPGAETASLTADQWYGCEYYKIMSQNIQGEKMYLLFGFSSNGMSSNKKILDVMTISENGPVFGAPLFLLPDARGQRLVTKSRMVLEYKKTAQVSLNYDNTKGMIMFNRLMSEINDPNRKNTYIPTGQTDGLRLENGQYMFVKDAIPVLKLQDGQAPIDGVMSGSR